MTTYAGLPRAPRSYDRMLPADAFVGKSAFVIGDGELVRAVHDALTASGATVSIGLPRTGAEAEEMIAAASPDILVTLPGRASPARAESLDASGVDEILEREFSVPYNAILAASRAVGERGGAIVAVVSAVAVTGAAGMAGAAAAQSSLCSATRSLAAEWAPRDLRVNSVAFGPLETLRDDLVASHVPAMRLGELRELGWLVAFLASPFAAYITGAHISIDGGDTLRRRLLSDAYTPDEFLTV